MAYEVSTIEHSLTDMKNNESHGDSGISIESFKISNFIILI